MVSLEPESPLAERHPLTYFDDSALRAQEEMFTCGLL